MIVTLTVAALAAPTQAELAATSVKPEPLVEDAFEAIGLYQARATSTSVGTTNPLLDGQVIGTLGGSNGTTVMPEGSAEFAEQRFNAFLTWRPVALDGRAELGAAFEVDMAFGDQSYAVGGNTGGAFGGDQVNLQTRRLFAAFSPRIGPDASVEIVTGLQLVTDGAHNPTGASPDALFRSGGRLMVVGTEAAGVTAYGKVFDSFGERLRWRLGAYTLYEVAFTEPDDVWLVAADLDVEVGWRTHVGVHSWTLLDRSGGGAGVLGVGPTSALSEMQGGPRLDLRAEGELEAPDAYTDVFWFAVDAGYDHTLSVGPIGLSGVAVVNVGRIYAGPFDRRPIAGGLVDGEARWRFASGRGSVARVEGLWTTRDDPTDPSRYGGVVTANTWGIAAATYGTHGGLLLFPDIKAINRQSAIVYDVSGRGEGVIAANTTVGYDVIPDRLNTTAGVAHARNSSGVPWGTELHGHVGFEPWWLVDVGVHGGVVLPGSRSLVSGLTTASGTSAVPWAMLLTCDWILL